MDAEKVFNLFDSFWFHRCIFEKVPDFSFSSSSKANPDGENYGVRALEEVIPRAGRSTSSSRGTQTISSSGSLSPNSVLSTSKLRSLFSDTTDLESSKPTPVKAALEKMKVGESETRRRRFERKSLPELEYEELKGFRDLGFVFSEEDRNSSLASIIPGLHRLGKEGNMEEEEEEEEEEEVSDASKIARPYLSEAWEDLGLDRRRKENPLLRKWKLPCLSNETDMKENLRWWAHTVASTVR